MRAWFPRDGLGWLFWAFGMLSLGNAAWMLAAPLHWYHELPAEVPAFGPFNPHFVRDIGCAFATIGFAFVWAALAPRWRYPLAVVGCFFYVAHAVLHVFDTLRGAVEPEHAWHDLPGVYLPAIVLIVAVIAVKRGEGDEHATRAD
jgi:hypothetical protein